MLKKTLVLASGLVLATMTFGASLETQEVTAASKTTCSKLNKTYKYGVKKSAKTKNKVVNSKTKKATYKTSKAKASASLYKKYSYLDNDRDGIACEK